MRARTSFILLRFERFEEFERVQSFRCHFFNKLGIYNCLFLESSSLRLTCIQ